MEIQGSQSATHRIKGRRVKSIAPEELNELIDAYLKEHPWEGALVEKVCF